MKYDHRFTLKTREESTFLFKESDINARLDFFKDMVRVAIYKDGSNFFNTFSVCPDGEMPYEGRDKLSCKGLMGEKTQMTEDDGGWTFTFGSHSKKKKKKNFLKN